MDLEIVNQIAERTGVEVQQIMSGVYGGIGASLVWAGKWLGLFSFRLSRLGLRWAFAKRPLSDLARDVIDEINTSEIVVSDTSVAVPNAAKDKQTVVFTGDCLVAGNVSVSGLNGGPKDVRFRAATTKGDVPPPSESIKQHLTAADEKAIFALAAQARAKEIADLEAAQKLSIRKAIRGEA